MGWAAWAWRVPSKGSLLVGGVVDVGEAGEAAVAAEVCWAVEADEAAVAAKVCWAVEAEADRVARTACMAGRRGPGGVSCMALPNTIQPTAALVLVVGGVVGWLGAWGGGRCCCCC